jgi:hypothetical protein
VKDLQDAAKFAFRIVGDSMYVVRDATLPTDAIKLRGLEKVRALQISAFIALVIAGLLFARVRTNPIDFDSLMFMIFTMAFVCLVALPVSYLVRRFSLWRTDDVYDESLAVSLGFLLVAVVTALLIHLGNVVFGLGLHTETLQPLTSYGSAIAGALAIFIRSFFGNKRSGTIVSPIGFALIVLLLTIAAVVYVHFFLVWGMV